MRHAQESKRAYIHFLKHRDAQLSALNFHSPVFPSKVRTVPPPHIPSSLGAADTTTTPIIFAFFHHRSRLVSLHTTHQRHTPCVTTTLPRCCINHGFTIPLLLL